MDLVEQLQRDAATLGVHLGTSDAARLIRLIEELERWNRSYNLTAVADQQPYRIGRLTVETAVQAKQGKSEPRYVLVPPKLYRKNEPDEVRQYLALVKSLAS